MKVFLWIVLLAALASPAFAQSSAGPVVPGYLTTTPQTNCPQSPCFVQFGAAPAGGMIVDTTGSGNLDAEVKAPIAVQSWGGGTLGAMANYGTPPGAVLVPGVNAFITNPISATFSGNSGAVTQSVVSVTNSSTALLTAAQFSNFEKICVAQTATTGVWINWANAAAVTAAPSEYVPPGQCDTWVKSTGFLPTAAAFAISNSASTIVVTVEGN